MDELSIPNSTIYSGVVGVGDIPLIRIIVLTYFFSFVITTTTAKRTLGST